MTNTLSTSVSSPLLPKGGGGRLGDKKQICDILAGRTQQSEAVQDSLGNTCSSASM